MNKEKKNRIYFLDLARGFAIFSMFLQHCMIIYEKTAGEGDTILGNIFILAGTAPAAPVFLLIFGIFLVKSKDSFRQTLLRGVKLLFLGYLLNFLRFTLPFGISGIDNVLYLQDESSLSLFFAVDILQLAGLSIFILLFLKKYSHSTLLFPILILFILLLSPYLWGKFPQIPFFLPLWGTGKNVYFPMFPWIIYPLLGMYISQYLFNGELLGKVLKKFFMTGIACFCAGILLFNIFPIGDYHRSGLSIHLVIIGFIFIWLPLCQVIIFKIPINNQILQLFFFWSRNVTSIYCIQWILFGWSLLIFEANQQLDYIAALIGVFVLILTHLLVKVPKIQQAFSWI